MSIEQQLANHMRQGNYNEYVAARYPEIGDGEDHIFKDEDFSDTDLRQFPLSFTIFDHCTLDGVKLSGFPITVRDSSAIGLNLIGASAIIDAYNSDLRGLRYNEHTILARPENGDAGCSHFYACQFDPETKEYFIKQGVVFRDWWLTYSRKKSVFHATLSRYFNTLPAASILPLDFKVRAPYDYHLYLCSFRCQEYVIVETDHLSGLPGIAKDAEEAFSVTSKGWCILIERQQEAGRELLPPDANDYDPDGTSDENYKNHLYATFQEYGMHYAVLAVRLK